MKLSLAFLASAGRSRAAGMAPGLAVCVAPALLLWLALHQPVTPAFLYVARDAGYYYLMNVFLVAQGRWAYLAAHPGATLQLFGGLLVRVLAWWNASPGVPMEELLLSRHALFARDLGLSLVALNAMLVFAFGLVACRKKMGLASTVLVQLTWVLSPVCLRYWGLFQPESAYPALAALLGIAILAGEERPSLAAITAGLAVATKLTYAPYLALCAIARGRRAALAFFGAIVLALACGLVFYPVWQGLLANYARLFLSGADYMGEQAGFLPWKEIWQRWKDSRLLPDLGLLAVAVFLGSLAMARTKQRALAALLTIAILGTFEYAKKSTHDYYLLPALGALPLLLACTRRALAENRALPWVRAAALLLLLLGLVQQVSRFSEEYRLRALFIRASTESENRLLGWSRRFPQCSLLLAGPLPNEADALRTGSSLAGKRWDAALRARYPHTFFLDSPDFVRLFSTPIAVPEGRWTEESACALGILNRTFSQSPKAQALRIVREGKRLDCDDFFCVFLRGQPEARP